MPRFLTEVPLYTVPRFPSVAGLFPNTESALRLVSAVLMEQSEEWETGRVYLTMSEPETA